jgi:probable DNA metabolism protein
MLVFYYDKTFEGLLCAVFDAFKLKKIPESLLAQDEVAPLLTTESHHVEIRNNKYERVQAALKKKLSKVTHQQLVNVWLSELPDSDLIIFRYVCKVFRSPHSIETDFADPDVLAVREISRKVSKEREYLMQFVRFNVIENSVTNADKDVKEKIYFAVIAPRYNALPLTLNFFKDRYADQKWAIYDEKRQYGFLYDLERIKRISLGDENDLIIDSQINQEYLSPDEVIFQTMWYRYCEALTIKERINPKLQRQQMPKRFWQYLPEMQDH